MNWKPRGKRGDMSKINQKLQMLKEGEHYSEDGKKDGKGPLDGAETLLRNPDPEESNTEKSSAMLSSLPISSRWHRDTAIDYGNPREELSKFGKYVDEVPPFDRPALSLFKPYDFDARKQTSMVLRGRASYAIEENKYNVTIDNAKDVLKVTKPPTGAAQSEPAPSPTMKRELARAALMETTSSL